jgi:hypothetical protein
MVMLFGPMASDHSQVTQSIGERTKEISLSEFPTDRDFNMSAKVCAGQNGRRQS